ncbi:MAG: zinc-dependent metalloprotease [Myxococcota bacterium]|nr:zinc-dependent metalloprotease [Myxococcota bacterium]
MQYWMMLFLGSMSTPLWADKPKNEELDEDVDKKDDTPSFADEVEEYDVKDGFFTVYQNPKTGSIRMAIREDQLSKEFLYFSYTENGVLAASHFKGSFRSTRIVKIEKYYERLEFVAQNTRFHFDEDSALSRSAHSNISPAVLATAKIKATKDEDGKKTYLIEMDDILLSDAFTQLKRASYPGESSFSFKMGSFKKDRSKIRKLKNYEKNTDFLVEYAYNNSAPTNSGGSEVTDARNISIQLQHSFIELPKNDFTPREDDFRVGYFHNQITDQTSASYTPYKDLINRWHLVKKDPEAALSEPVEPIVWYLENTTPVEFREDVKAGVLAWNIAFEDAGFKNAIVVKQQPDDAEWDAGDIQYNVLRWTSSPRPPFGGYGPSFSNPRTGQLIGADIMLEYVYMTNRVRYRDLLSSAFSIEEPAAEAGHCMHGSMMRDNMLLGMVTLDVAGAPEAEKERLIKEGLRHLVLHEVGHTLGLNHNMKSSSAIPLDEMHDMALAEKRGLVPSVMDYTPINLAPKGQTQGKYFSDVPGAYDRWAIQFGYTPSLSDPEKEKERVQALLSRSSETLLTFGNDADDMRSPGKAIDPRVNTGELSDDLVAWAEQRFEIVEELEEGVFEQYKKEGQSWHPLLGAYSILRSLKVRTAYSVSRLIGGVYVERGTTEQFSDGRVPYRPVPFEEQERALDMLAEYLFSPDATNYAEELLPYLQPQRRGFNFFGETEDPKIHSNTLGPQAYVLRHLLHPRVLQRLSDSALYGNEMTSFILLDRLTDAIFEDDRYGDVSDMRKNLQMHYVKRLVNLYDYGLGSDASAHASVLHALQKVKKYSKEPFLFGGDAHSQIHRANIRALVKEY